MTDRQLLQQIRAGNRDAWDDLLTRYKPLVRSKVTNRFLPGGDREDLLQEGMIGLFQAAQDYDLHSDVPFPAFASLCVHARITDAVRRASRLKHQVLSDSVSLEQTADVAADSPDAPHATPERLLQSEEELEDVFEFMHNELSSLEQDVTALKAAGYSHAEISQKLDRTVKSVDNALQRARRKLTKYFKGNRHENRAKETE